MTSSTSSSTASPSAAARATWSSHGPIGLLPMHGCSGRRRPLLAFAEIDDAFQPLGRPGRRLRIAQEPVLEMVVKYAGDFRQVECGDRIGHQADRLQHLHTRYVADHQAGRAFAK